MDTKKTLLSANIVLVTNNIDPSMYNDIWFVKKGVFGMDEIAPGSINVPGFTGVRIHSGNDPKTDSSGCILPGYNTIKGKVTSSRKVMEVLMEKLKEVPTSETIELEIIQ